MNIKNTIRIITLIFLLTFIIFTSVALGENEATGFTVKSITSSNIISNSESLKKSNVTILIGLNGDGQSIYGDFGNETLIKHLNNVLIKYPFKLETGKLEEMLTYTILNEGMLFKYEYHIINTTNIWTGALCDDSDFCFPIRYSLGQTIIGDDRIVAVNRIPIGMYGSLSKPDINWKSKIIITINGIPYSQNMGSGVGTAGSINFKTILGEYVANAKWDGSLVTGQATPTQTNYVPTYISPEKSWKIAPINIFNAYTKSLDDIDTTFNQWKSINYRYDYNNYICGFNETCDIVIRYINNHNNILDKLVKANVNIGYGSPITSTSTIISKRENDKVYGYVIDKLDRKFGNPEITIYTTASILGIYIPTGKPEIQEITTDFSDSGDGKNYIHIKVKNIGDYTGTFSAYLTDDSETFLSSINVESAKIKIKPKDIGTITLSIDSGTIIQDEIIKGLVKVYDVNDPENADEKEVDLKSQTPKVCTPGSYREFSGKVYECNSDGSDESLRLICNDGQIKYVNDEPTCVGIDNVDINKDNLKSITTGDKKEEPKEKEKEQGGIFIDVLYYIMGFLILTSIFIIVNKIRNEEPKITKKNMDNSMLLAGIITCLLYLYIQYVALSEALGLVLWASIILIIIIVGAINFISYSTTKKMLPVIISIIIAIGLFIIIMAITTGMKNMMCDNWLTSWMFSNCKKFSLTDYLFK